MPILRKQYKISKIYVQLQLHCNFYDFYQSQIPQNMLSLYFSNQEILD